MIHTSYIDHWVAMGDRVFEERDPTINIDTYMTWYLSITSCFIIPIRSHFLRHPCNSMHYASWYLRQNWLVCNIALYLLNIRLILLWMMTTNWLSIYVYRLITWYKKFKKWQQLFVKLSMEWDVLWLPICLIYIIVGLKRLSILKQ